MIDLTKILNAMTLKEKIAQMVQITPSFFNEGDANQMTGTSARIPISDENRWNIGSVLNCRDAEAMIAIQKEYMTHNRHGIPLVFMNDVIHGYRTIFPEPNALACSFDMDLIREAARIMSEEASYSGIHVTFAPMLDIVRDPRWGRVVESPGEDKYLAGEIARAWIEGIQGKDDKELRKPGKLAACAKHFVGYGAVEGGRDYNTTDISEWMLKEVYMHPFSEAVKCGCSMIMTAFTTYEGIPVSASKKVLNQFLRQELGFKGMVISDWAAVKEIYMNGAAQSEEDAAGRAVTAGVDMEMMSEYYLKYLEKLVKDGSIDIEVINNAVLRILTLKEKLGLFENPYKGADVKKERELQVPSDNSRSARIAAAKSMVLLKNDGILPLDRALKIAVIGPYADQADLNGPWSMTGHPYGCVSLADGIKSKIGHENIWVLKTELGEQDDLCYPPEQLARAVLLAGEADVVILALGEGPQKMGGEDSGRTEITIPECQRDLSERVSVACEKTVTVIFNNRPLDLTWFEEHTSAILEAWFPGTEGGNAAADLLFGDVNPSGRLTMSFPLSVGQIPVYYNRYSTGRPNVSGGFKTKYCVRYLDKPITPLYPFGYGLSYTTYEYKDFALSAGILSSGETITASVTVANTGDRDGEETVQLYIRDVRGSVIRPILELKGFKKVLIRAGENLRVEFEITAEMLAFFTDDMTFKPEPGEFEVYIGHDSASLEKQMFTLRQEGFIFNKSGGKNTND